MTTTQTYAQALEQLQVAFDRHVSDFNELQLARSTVSNGRRLGDLVPSTPEYKQAVRALSDAETAYNASYQLVQYWERQALLLDLAENGAFSDYYVGHPLYCHPLLGASAEQIQRVHDACANARWAKHREHALRGDAAGAAKFAMIRGQMPGESAEQPTATDAPPAPHESIPHVWCADCKKLVDHVSGCDSNA